MSPARPITVGVDAAVTAGDVTGVPRYVARLMDALAVHPSVRRVRVWPAWGDDLPARVRSVHVPGRGRAGLPGAWRWVPGLAADLWSRRPHLRRLLLGGAVDVAHGTAWTVPERDPVRSPATVVTVHDLSFLTHPEWLPPEVAERCRVQSARWSDRADHLVTHSRTVADQACELLGADPAGITVAPLAPDPALAPVPHADGPPEPQALGVDPMRPLAWGPDGWWREPFVLHVGAVQPRKDLATLARAVGRLRAGGSGGGRVPRLVLAGGPAWRTSGLWRAMAEAGLGPSRPGGRGTGAADGGLVRTGQVTDAELRWLMAAASCLAYPTRMEGFGLPPLEAMHVGCPTVVSDLGVLRETCGDATLYAAPGDVDRWTDALAALAGRAALRCGLARDLVARGRRRAAVRTWAHTAERTVVAYRTALRRRAEAA